MKETDDNYYSILAFPQTADMMKEGLFRVTEVSIKTTSYGFVEGKSLQMRRPSLQVIDDIYLMLTKLKEVSDFITIESIAELDDMYYIRVKNRSGVYQKFLYTMAIEDNKEFPVVIIFEGLSTDYIKGGKDYLDKLRRLSEAYNIIITKECSVEPCEFSYIYGKEIKGKEIQCSYMKEQKDFIHSIIHYLPMEDEPIGRMMTNMTFLACIENHNRRTKAWLDGGNDCE